MTPAGVGAMLTCYLHVASIGAPVQVAQALEAVVNEGRARELVAGERTRVETSLGASLGDVQSEGLLGRQQAGEPESGSELATEMVDVALVADLRATLAAVGRAEARIAAGTYGRSIDSGVAIPDGRLEAAPLAERTLEEQRRYEETGADRTPVSVA